MKICTVSKIQGGKTSKLFFLKLHTKKHDMGFWKQGGTLAIESVLFNLFNVSQTQTLFYSKHHSPLIIHYPTSLLIIFTCLKCPYYVSYYNMDDGF